MKNSSVLLARALLRGLLIIVPIYLAILLLLKGLKSLTGLVRPIAVLLPSWFPGEIALSVLLLIIICIVVGAVVRTRTGQAARERLEKAFFERIPGYGLLRSLTQQVAGEGREKVWKPALTEMANALVPSFVIEELDDGRYTIFIPSIPTPFSGAVYVIDRARVHPVDVPFTQVVKVISKWGSGAKNLVAAMEREASLSR